MTTIQEQVGQLDNLQSNAPGVSIDRTKAEIDEWVQKVVGIAGEGLGGVPELRATAEAAKQSLDTAAQALAQLPLDVSSIISRINGG